LTTRAGSAAKLHKWHSVASESG